ncbi:5'-3'-deoxyribonucleotidase [Candidatus Pacearchaeota archaeon]|nr:5'-3'-deoxyribonucleotidase [Candidatus Pacearchaeota archaeon]
MIILVDMDGVLADYNLGIEKELKKRCLWTPDRNEFKTFYYADNCPPEYGKVIDVIGSKKGFAFDLPSIKGGKEALEKMLELGQEVRICTAPFGDYKITIPEKLAWAEYNIGKGWAKKIVLTKDKTLIRGDILIDDKPKILGIMEPVWEHVLYDKSYNKEVEGKRRLTWENWREVLGI